MRIIRLFLAAIMVLAGTVMVPGVVNAAPESFSTSGSITDISAANEQPAGNSGRFVVYERTATGFFNDGDLDGPFSMIYKANVELATQAGTMSGKLTSGSFTFAVSGKSQPISWFSVDGGMIGQLSGRWNSSTQKVDGEGTFTSNILFIPTPDGHISRVLPGSFFSMTGQMKL